MAAGQLSKNMKYTTENDVRRLPLWEHTLSEMRKAGVDYGSTFSRRWMEDHLSCAWNTAEFNSAVISIRAELENEGFYLSARGQGERGYIILRPKENAEQGIRNQRLAVSLLKRTVVLLSNTRLDDLTADERRRHEAVLSRAAQRAALVSRAMPKRLQGGCGGVG